MPRLRPSTALSLVVARACPPPGFHVIITTCVGLRTRRARALILLASNPAKACCSPLSLSTAASRNCGHARFMGLAILAPHRNIYAFRYERKRKMHSHSHPRSPQKSLHPPHEKFRPVVPMLLEHACIPRFLKPFEVVPLCWGQVLAEAGESIQDFPSALLRKDSTAATAALAQFLE